MARLRSNLPRDKRGTTFVVSLRAADGIDPTFAIRRLLRYALRSCGLRCTRITRDPLELKAPGERGITDAGSAHARLDSDGL
jgi:hypothetical protein